MTDPKTVADLVERVAKRAHDLEGWAADALAEAVACANGDAAAIQYHPEAREHRADATRYGMEAEDLRALLSTLTSLEAEREEAQGFALGWHRAVETILTIAALSPALGATEAVEAMRARIAELERGEAERERMREAWSWLDANVGMELSWGEGADDIEGDPCVWRVHRCHGGRSDLEWDLIATGPTPLEAVANAAALTPEPKP